jgi:hypothetical protein
MLVAATSLITREVYSTMQTISRKMTSIGRSRLTLPPVGLLDERFIDEARTVAFHESGKWKATDREDLYQRARRRMMVYGLSKENLKSAEDNADAQFRQLLRSMGFENVVIRFRRSSE